VIDLTHHIAGPFCTKLLADYGADVIKIEQPGVGDASRHRGPFLDDCAGPDRSGTFLWLNTNKRSVTLNLKDSRGQAVLHDLVKGADSVVESYAPAVSDRLGLGFAALAAGQPRLVETRITNFGQFGPYRDYKATEAVFYAMGGLMYITGDYAREPLKHGLTQAQLWAGLTAAISTLAAVMADAEARAGQQIDVSIQECLVAGMMMKITNYAYLGAISRRDPKGQLGLQGLVEASDGYVSPVLGAGTSWQTLAEFLELPELNDPKFATPDARLLNADELDALVSARFKERTRYEWMHGAQAADLPFGVVQTAEDLLNCPQLNARGYFVEMDHPVVGERKYPGRPVRTRGSRDDVMRPAPTLGQHTREVLMDELGYSSEAVDELVTAGVV